MKVFITPFSALALLTWWYEGQGVYQKHAAVPKSCLWEFVPILACVNCRKVDLKTKLNNKTVLLVWLEAI